MTEVNLKNTKYGLKQTIRKSSVGMQSKKLRENNVNLLSFRKSRGPIQK